MLKSHTLLEFQQALSCILSAPIKKDAILVFTPNSAALLVFKTRDKDYKTDIVPIFDLQKLSAVSDKPFSTTVSSLTHCNRDWTTARHGDDGYFWVEATNGVFKLNMDSHQNYPNSEAMDNLPANRANSVFVNSVIATITTFLQDLEFVGNGGATNGPYYIQGD